MNHGGSHSPRWALSRRLRIGLVFLALAALVAPMAYLFGSFWSATSQDRARVTAERGGITYLEPLVYLVGTLADAQAAAVNGKAVDAEKLRAAVTTVDAVDQREGAALGARQRWTKLRDDIDATLSDNPQGAPAYRAYNNLTTPALALVAKVADTSGLTTDQEFEAYSTVLQLPGVVVHSGQVTSLLRPADPASNSRGGSHGGGDHAGATAAAAAARVAVALDRVSTAREAVRDGLRRGEGATVTDADALKALDELSAAVDALARVAGPAAEGEAVSPRDADNAGARVRRAALALHDQMLAALDTRLAVREDMLGDQRVAAALAMVTGLLLAAALLWLSLPARPQREAGEPDGHLPGSRPQTVDPRDLFGGVSPGVSPGGVSPGVSTGVVPGGAVGGDNGNIREELLHVGRAVRSTGGEPGDGSR